MIRDRARDTVFKLDMRQRCIGCKSNQDLNCDIIDAYFCVFYRTDHAVLAVNGFAADGNVFVKTVKQRLEVSSKSRILTDPRDTDHVHHVVV